MAENYSKLCVFQSRAVTVAPYSGAVGDMLSGLVVCVCVCRCV